jgi:hypothetical protein
MFRYTFNQKLIPLSRLARKKGVTRLFPNIDADQREQGSRVKGGSGEVCGDFFTNQFTGYI